MVSDIFKVSVIGETIVTKLLPGVPGNTVAKMSINISIVPLAALSGKTDTGVIKNLYPDERYVVASPIINGETAKGIVIASTPTAATNAIMQRISNIFLSASLAVVLIAVLAVVLVVVLVLITVLVIHFHILRNSRLR